MERTCRKCGETKPIEEFNKRKDSNSGYNRICKECCNQRTRNRLLKPLSHELRLKSQRKYRSLNKTRCNEGSRKSYDLHKHKESRHDYRNKNRESILEAKNKLVTNLNEQYVIECIKQRFELKRDVIKQHPELIENYRQQIKVKRLIKSKKNENIKA